MSAPPERVDSLAWYDPLTPGLERMFFETKRKDFVDLKTLHPGYPKNQWVGVPRVLAPEPTVDKDFRSIGLHEFDAKFTSTLRAEQEPFVDGVFRMLEDDLGGIGMAPTGFGKTVTGCALTAHIGRTTCIIIPKGDLDWTGALLKHTNIPKERIDYWQADHIPSPDAWVTIAMLQSVYQDARYPQEIYDRFGCVIIDEVHRVGSDEFSKALVKFPAMWKLGLSATPDRRDGKMPLVRAHLGSGIVKGFSDAAQPDYYVIESQWEEPIGYNGEVVPFDPSRTNQAKRSLMSDPYRNSQIAAVAYRLHKANRRTVLFCEQKKHIDRLHQSLQEMGVPDHLLCRYYGDAPEAEKQRCFECPPGMVMLATYKYTAEGTDIPALDAAIFAHPIYDPRQPKGRITRKLEGKPKPILIDVVDVNCGALRRIHQARWNYLMEDGCAWKGPVDKPAGVH